MQIQKRRMALGWTRRELAKRAQITEQTIKNLERPGWDRICQLRIREGLAKALSVDKATLFKRDGRVR